MGFELNRLMQMYGVNTPGMQPYGGQVATQADPARAAHDQNAYQNYSKEYQNRLMSGNMYNQAQFMPDPTKYVPPTAAPIAAPMYSPTNLTDINAAYGQLLGRAPEPEGLQYWGAKGLTGEALRSAIGASPEAKNYQISEIYNKYFGRPPEEAGLQFWSQSGASGDALKRAILSGAQNSDRDYFQQNYPGYQFARGGAVNAGYAEGGEVEDPETERSNRGPMTPEGAARMAALLGQMMPTTNYGAQLASAQQAARGETEAFSNMVRQMSERTESPTSRAEMYFRLASAFGAPTRTGQFTENLALAGREMGEYTRGRAQDEAERRALALRAQELRMAGARQDLASLQTLAGQESAERRAINARIIDAQARAGAPNARETRIVDTMQTYGFDRPTAMRLVDGQLRIATDPITGAHTLVDLVSGESRPATPRPAVAPTAPAPAGATAPATSVPRGPAGESARPERTLYELASVPRTTGLLPAIGEGAQRIAGQVGANVVPAEFTERRQAFLNVQNEIIRAVINNPRFPVAEQERIRRELNIEPSMLTDPQTLLARIRTLDSTLRTSLANREREGGDASLPVDVRRGALQAANEARNLLQILGVPQGGEEPAPASRPRRRDSLQRPRAPQQEGWSIQPVE